MIEENVSARSSSSSIARRGCSTSGAFTNGSNCSTDDIRYSDDDARQPLPEDQQVDRDPRSGALCRRGFGGRGRIRGPRRGQSQPSRAASRGSIPVWRGPRTRHRAPAIFCRISRCPRAALRTKSKSAAISSSTKTAPRPSRIFMSAPAAMCCAGRRRLENRVAPARPRPERDARQKHQHVFLISSVEPRSPRRYLRRMR